VLPMVEGPFQLLRRLSNNPGQRTYLGVDEMTRQLVVLKRTNHQGADACALDLAEREIQLVRKLAHPAFAPFHCSFERANAHYLVTRFVQGEDLARARLLGKRLTEEDVLSILRDMAGAFDYLHQLLPPVVHRDVTPKHILRGIDGRHRLLDFRGACSAELEGSDETVGTFGYMAPEQFQGLATCATDLYGLGATLLALMTHKEPEELPHQGSRIDVRRALAGDVDQRLVRLLQALLEPELERRPTRLAPLLVELESAPRAVARASVQGAELSSSQAGPSSRSLSVTSGVAWGPGFGGTMVVGMSLIGAAHSPYLIDGGDPFTRLIATAVGWFYPVTLPLLIGISVLAAGSLHSQRARWHAWLSLAFHICLAGLVLTCAPFAMTSSIARTCYLLGTAAALLTAMPWPVLIAVALGVMVVSLCQACGV
jgi:serine/threonine protein kinase